MVALTRLRPAGSASATPAPVAVSGPLLATDTTNVTWPLNDGVAVSTVFVTAKSASRPSTDADAELSADVGSNVADETIAVFVRAVGTVTVAMMLNVALVPLARLPTVHVPDAYVPVDGVALTSDNPAGSASATETACAVSGPLLLTVTVNVTLAPTDGVALLTVFVTARSASRASTVAEAMLFAGLGS